MTDDIVAFLRARLMEDWNIAHGTLWGGSDNQLKWDTPFTATLDTGGDTIHINDATIARHIARHDPAHVIRDVTAKRALLNAYAATLDLRDAAAEQVRASGTAVEDRHLDNWARAGTEAIVMGGIVAHFAAVYDQHPDYQEAWRP
jgi:hypothetical protein